MTYNEDDEDIRKELAKQDRNTIIAAVLAGIVLMVVIIAFRYTALQPRIIVMREQFVETMDGGLALCLDYYVAGHVQNVIFYEYEMDEYSIFMEYLRSVGRVKFMPTVEERK